MATVKQKRAFRRLVENPKIPVGQAMREAGYSMAISQNPKRLTESNGFKELVREYLPSEHLLKVHQEGLGALKKEHKIVGADENGRPVYDIVDMEDYGVRHKYLETAYRLRGDLDGSGKSGTTNVLQINMYDPEQQLRMAERVLQSRVSKGKGTPD